MIDFKVKAKEMVTFDDLPVGRYQVYVHEVKEWQEKIVKDAMISQRDENGETIWSEKGKPLKEKIAELKYVAADVVLKVVDGEFKGRNIFTRVSTHPDALFVLEGFLFALDLGEINVGELKKHAEGLPLEVDLDYRTYNKITTDKNTGIDTVEEKKAQNVKKFYRITF